MQVRFAIGLLIGFRLIFFDKKVVAQSDRHVGYVVLISIDGLRPEFYRDASWPTPNLHKLVNEGVSADHMTSVFPSYTYPAHTAMITGALPVRSGINFNTKPGSTDWYWFSKDIKTPTLWQELKRKNMTSAAIHWPVTAGAEIDYNIPEIWHDKDANDRITASEKYAAKGLIEELEVNATGRLDSVTMNALIMGDNVARIAQYIFEKKKPNLLAVHFIEVDHEQHVHGRNHEAVRLALANVDHYIGRIIETIKASGEAENTTVIIVGDHGFHNINMSISPNIWISDLVKAKKGSFVPSGGSAFLYLTDPYDLKTLNEIQKRLRELPQSYKRQFRVINRAALDKMGADSNASLALAANAGVVFRGASEGEVIGTVEGGHHGYDPSDPNLYTGFIAWGRDIKIGTINELNVADVAPLMAKLLGVEFSAPDGMLVPGILVKSK